MFSWWRKNTASTDAILGETYRLLQQELTNGDNGDSLVLIDDLAHLEWVGIEDNRVLSFLRALRSLLHKVRPIPLNRTINLAKRSLEKTGGSLIALYHTLSTESPMNSVCRYLLHTCTCHVGCRPLGSGRSGAVSGEVSYLYSYYSLAAVDFVGRSMYAQGQKRGQMK